jgi:hypothetical protein
MEKQILTSEEITQIKDYQTQLQDVVSSLGALEMQSINIQLQKDKLKEKYLELASKEQEIATELEKKYGKGSISLDTGEFIPMK